MRPYFWVFTIPAIRSSIHILKLSIFTFPTFWYHFPASQLRHSLQRILLLHRVPLIIALLLTGSVLTGFSTQAAPSKTESDDHQAQEISEAVFRMDGAAAQVSYDGGSTWDASPTVELPDFYSYEEFAGWIETESDNLQALVAAGELTQEEAAAAIAQYQSALSGIEDGVQVGKRSSYEEDQVFFSMPNNPQSEVFQTVLYDGNSYRNFGPYNTKAELYAALEQYTNDQTKSGNMTEVEANSILDKYR